MKKLIWGAFIFSYIVGLGSCALPKKHKVGSSQASSTSSHQLPPTSHRQEDVIILEDGIVEEEIGEGLFSMTYINDRIFTYGQKLERWKGLDKQALTMDLPEEDIAKMVGCFRRLQDVLNDYSDLRKRILQGQINIFGPENGGQYIYEIQKKDINFLEDTCGRLLSDANDQLVWSSQKKEMDLAQLEGLIDNYAANGEYEEVIRTWQEIAETQLDEVHPRAEIIYADSLVYRGETKKATQIYQQILDRIARTNEHTKNSIYLRKTLADLYIAAKEYGSAARLHRAIIKKYQDISRVADWSKLQLLILDESMLKSQELAEYSSILKNFLGFIPKLDGYRVVWQTERFLANYPQSSVVANINFIRETVLESAERWFEISIGELDRLYGERKYTEALELLATMPMDSIGVEKQFIIKELGKELTFAEATAKEAARLALMQELQNQLDNGILLAEGGRYDEAIGVITNLLGTEYSTEAKEKIRQVTLEAATADRKEAANLFVKFTLASDLESKKQFLIGSRKLLKNILVKYPRVEIVAKVVSNINQVEQEMNAIDPKLLPMIDLQESQSVQHDDIDRAFMVPDK